MLPSRLLSLFAALAAAFAGCDARKQSPAPRDFEPMEAAGMLRNGFAVVLDVREAPPAGGAARESIDPMGAQALVLPASEVGREDRRSSVLGAVAGDKTVLVYGESREAARKAAQLLSSADARHSFGSLPAVEEWKAARLPVRSR